MLEGRLLEDDASRLGALLRVAACLAGVPRAEVELLDEALPTALGVTASRLGGPLHVRDTRADPRFRDNPWVDGRLASTRSYTAVPLLGPGGRVLGVLAAPGSAPRDLGEDVLARLGDLGELAAGLVVSGRRARRERDLAAAVAEATELVELAHTELEVRHDLLEAVLDTAEVGIAAIDAEGRLTVLNDAARRWHAVAPGLPPERVAPAARATLFEADGVTPLAAGRNPLRRALREGAVDDVEVVVAAAGRPAVTTVARARALTRADGRVTGAVMSMVDVTAERAAAVELQRSNAELQQFAAIASHDLRSPLTVVDGYLELLGDVYGDALGERGRAWLATAGGGVARMATLIDALLGYAQAGAQVLAPEPVDVRALLDLAVLDLRTAITAADARITTEGPLPTVRADPVQLRQLLQNLLANAVKFHRPGHPARIRCSVVAQAGHWLFAVADDGVGIPEHRREQVFRMFDRADRRSGAGHGAAGHGIGLATAERIVTRHGGRVWAEETPGGGTTIRFTVPRDDPDPGSGPGWGSGSGPDARTA